MSATFNSIGVEVLFSGDENANATGEVAFRPAGESDWRAGLSLWRTNDGSVSPGPAFYGSVLLVEPGTAYDVQVTLSDPDGVSGTTGTTVGSAVLAGKITTRAETIVPAGVLLPTHYVRTGGSDTNSGTSPTSAWRTLEKAIVNAPAGAIVQVGPGRYERPRSLRSLPLTLVAQYPALDDQRNVINAGLHSIIDYGWRTAPQSGTWQRVTLTGPGYGGAPAGATYSIWKWSSPTTGRPPESLAYARTLDETPQRIALWYPEGTDLTTPEGFVEKLFTNQSYNYGWTSYRKADGTYDLYARLPGERNPNDYFMIGGEIRSSTAIGTSLFAITGPQFRLSGFRLVQGQVYLDPAASSTVIDHNLLELAVVYLAGGKPSTYGSDHVIEHNRIVDTNIWTNDHVGAPAIPWIFIKGAIANADGTLYGSTRIGAAAERTAVKNSGGAHRVVIRRNTIEGIFNGVGGYGSGYDRYSAYNNDVYENLFRRITDDALEPEHNVINWRAWDNRIEDASVILSLGPVNYGPIYLFRNEAWRIGPQGAGMLNNGARGVSGKGFKYSGSSTPTARIFVLHNTFWSDDPGGDSGVGVSGADQSAGGGSSQEAFYLRNNIIRFTKYAFVAPGGSRWDEDANYFGTTDTGRGVEYAGRRYTTDVEAYRSVSGQGTRTNRSGNFITVPTLVNAIAGDLSLPAGSPLIDAGVPVPNLSDRPGMDFAGTAPDLGARER